MPLEKEVRPKPSRRVLARHISGRVSCFGKSELDGGARFRGRLPRSSASVAGWFETAALEGGDDLVRADRIGSCIAYPPSRAPFARRGTEA